jgi:hypothetical protein
VSEYTLGPLAIVGKIKGCHISGFTTIGRGKKEPPTAYVANPYDAALYAAAPDLLQAVKDCLGEMSHNGDSREVRERAGAAIAKAEGRS